MNRRHFLRRTAAATAGLALALPRRGACTDERERDGQRRDHRPSRRQQGPRHLDGEGPGTGSLRTSQRHRQRPHHPCGGRRRTAFQRLAVLCEAEVRGGSEDGDGFPARARRQRRRCGDHRRARSLACAHDDLGLPGGKGRLRRKAHQPQHRRRPADDRRRAALRPHRRGRNPEAQQRRARQGSPVPSRRRAGHRLCGKDRGLPPENSDRSRGGQRGARRRQLRSVARTGAFPSVQREPFPLSLALVLGIRHDRSWQHGRPLPGRRALAAWKAGTSA